MSTARRRARLLSGLRTEFCELSTVVTELRQMLAAENAKVLDLPPLPLVRQVN
jgi:hypothetical protein